MNPGAVVISRTGAAVTADFSNATGAPIVGDTATGKMYWFANGAPFPLNIRVPIGAVGDGVTDDTSAIQSAITSAGLTGESIFLPAGNYLISSPLVFTKAINFFGEGWRSIIVPSASMSAVADVLALIPAAGSGVRGFYWGQFKIAPIAGTPARHGIHIDLTAVGAFVANAIFDHIDIEPLGGRAFVLTNPVNTDGFFTSTIQYHLFSGGVYFDRVGDSVYIFRGTLTGANPGVEMSMVPTAAQGGIIENNITSAGGAVVLHSGNQLKIQRNQVEQSATYTGAGNSSIWVRGDISEVIGTDIVGNNVNGSGKVSYCVTVENALNTAIGGKNTMSCASADNHINVNASAINTVIEATNDFFVDGLSAAAKIVDGGAVQTYGPPTTVAAFSNGWVIYDAVNFPVRYLRNEAGIVTISGAVKDGTTASATEIFTVPVGFRPSTGIYFAVTNNNLGVWQYGTVLVTPAGSVQIISGNSTLLSFGGISYKAAL